MQETTPPAAPKTRFLHKLAALLMLLICVGLAGAIIFYAKRTGHDPAMLPTALDVAKSAPASRTAQSDPEKPALPTAEPFEESNMVVVETPSMAPEQPQEQAQAENTNGEIRSDLAQMDLKLRDLAIELQEKSSGTKSAIELASIVQSLQKDVLALTEKMSAVESMLISVKQAQEQGVSQDISLLLAAQFLTQSIDSGAPYQTAWELIQPYLRDDKLKSILGPLEAYAAKGIAPKSRLIEQFPKIASMTARDAARQDAHDWAAGWIGEGIAAKSIASFAGLMTIRNTDADAAGGLDAQLNAIENAMHGNDFVKASEVFLSLPQSRDAALAEWGRQLRARAEAQAALTGLQKHLLQRLESQRSSSLEISAPQNQAELHDQAVN